MRGPGKPKKLLAILETDDSYEIWKFDNGVSLKEVDRKIRESHEIVSAVLAGTMKVHLATYRTYRPALKQMPKITLEK